MISTNELANTIPVNPSIENFKTNTRTHRICEE